MNNNKAHTNIGPIGLSVVDETIQVSLGTGQTALKNVLFGAAGLGLLAVPTIFDGYLVRLIVIAFIFSIFAISVDLVWGYAGILTFGHAAFFGLGAYFTGVLATQFSLSSIGLVGFVLAFTVSAVIGTLIAGVLFSRGISEEYFTIITLALAIVASQGAIILSSITGGTNGLAGIPSLGIDIPGVFMYAVPRELFYFFVLGALISVFLVGKRIVQSPFGTTLIGINENERKMSSLGYNPSRYKALVFGLSTGIAGFAGALYAVNSGFISPPILGFVLSTEVLIWVLIGGRGTLIGPIIGTTVLVLAENLFSGLFLSTWTLLLGLLLVAIVLVFPAGIAGLFSIVEEKIIKQIEKP